MKILLSLLLAAATLNAADWPQWRGPDRTGHVRETLAKLPAEPTQLWKIPSTEGLSSPVVANGRVFHFEAENGKEVLRALDAKTGERIWSAEIDETFKDSQGPAGPRNTPVVDGTRVYATSCKGELQCLDAATGKKIWRANFTNDFGALFIGERGKAPGATRHGNNGSPLIHGDHLIACVGSTNGAGIVAFNKTDGKVIWKSLNEEAAYAPPVLLNLAGADQIVAFMVNGLFALSPKDGKLLWSFPMETAFARHVTTPVAHKDIVVVSSHQVGMVGVKISKQGSAFKAEQAWLSKDTAMNFASPVAVGSHLFGLGPNANLICVEIETGKLTWSKPGYFTTGKDKAHAGFIAFERSILCLTDSGQLLLFENNPQEFKELGTAQIIGLNWCNPAYADGVLYAREGIKTTGNLAAFKIR